MATLIVPEATGREVLQCKAAPPPSGLQRLLQESLSVLSHWYDSSHGGGGEDEAGEVGGEKEEIPLVELPADPQPRLHPAAESCLSSLRAGTASISTAGAAPDFLNLPVRQQQLFPVFNSQAEASLSKF